MRKVIAFFLMATWAVGILYILFGPYFADLQARMENVRQERSEWPSVPGTIEEVQFHAATDDNDSSYVLFKFRYNVSGVLYNTAQKWADYTAGYKEAREKAKSQQPGQPVTVYYNPADTRQAVLYPTSVDLYEVSTWWETVLRILTYPSIIIGCAFIWQIITNGKTHNSMKSTTNRAGM